MKTKTKVLIFGDRITATVESLAEDYKFKKFNKYYAWDMFVKDRSLKPEVNAKEFYYVSSL